MEKASIFFPRLNLDKKFRVSFNSRESNLVTWIRVSLLLKTSFFFLNKLKTSTWLSTLMDTIYFLRKVHFSTIATSWFSLSSQVFDGVNVTECVQTSWNVTPQKVRMWITTMNLTMTKASWLQKEKKNNIFFEKQRIRLKSQPQVKIPCLRYVSDRLTNEGVRFRRNKPTRL